MGSKQNYWTRFWIIVWVYENHTNFASNKRQSEYDLNSSLLRREVKTFRLNVFGYSENDLQ